MSDRSEPTQESLDAMRGACYPIGPDDVPGLDAYSAAAVADRLLQASEETRSRLSALVAELSRIRAQQTEAIAFLTWMLDIARHAPSVAEAVHAERERIAEAGWEIMDSRSVYMLSSADFDAILAFGDTDAPKQ